MQSITFNPDAYESFRMGVEFFAEREFVAELRGELIQLSRVTEDNELIYTAYADGHRQGEWLRIELDAIRELVIV